MLGRHLCRQGHRLRENALSQERRDNMEFYNERLLSKGLPEMIAQMVPHDIYPSTKVIAHRRNWMKPGKTSSVVQGHAYYDNLTGSFCIGLYPIACCHHALLSRLGYSGGYPGTTSYSALDGYARSGPPRDRASGDCHTSKDDLYRYGHRHLT